MDDEQDISPKGDPEPDNADLRADDTAPFEEDQPLDSEQDQESPEDLADAADEAAEGLEEAVDSLDEEAGPSPTRTAAPTPPATSVASDTQAVKMVRPEVPVDTGRVSSPPPAEEMADITSALDVSDEDAGGDDSYGEQLNAFNEAGGADGGGDSGVPGGEPGDMGGGGSSLGDFADAVVNHAEKQDDMLSESIRRLDMMTQKLEIERL